MKTSFQPNVAILLCTYEGRHFLREQLDSFATQTHPTWNLWVSDDGSQDETHAILDEYKEKWPAKLKVFSGPGKGFVANFLALICQPEIEADYYAFSDQDDIWEAGKLERALAELKNIPPEVPALYCSRTRLVDDDNNEIGFSPAFAKPPSFANALVQSIAGGNTMVMNRAARELIREGGKDVDIVTHDWWVYLLVSGAGGEVYYDLQPFIRYRQHGANLVGQNSSWSARLVRIRKLFAGNFREWNDRNINALQKLRAHLTPENQFILDTFMTSRKSWLFPRIIGYLRTGMYRQTMMGNLGLVVAAIFNRL